MLDFWKVATENPLDYGANVTFEKQFDVYNLY